MNSIQPTYNIGLVGHVSHGKSTVVKALTGIETFKHSKEKERGVTMKIGYANCKIYKCIICPEPQCYFPCGSSTKSWKCIHCDGDTELIQNFSFIDCPGHESLMNIMLSGATVMDYAILLIDGSQKFPQPQTVEHLIALEILQIKKIIIIQNKLDLVECQKAADQYAEIKAYVKNTCAESAPIIPFSAQKRYNIDILCEYIVKYFGQVTRIESAPKMNIIRSFDINKPGSSISSLTGGVIGGTLIAGQFKVGDMIEIRPGLVSKDQSQLVCKPIITEIISMKTDNDLIDVAIPGGLIGICTNLDPLLTKCDRMIGQVAGLVGTVDDVYTEINAKCIFIKRVSTTLGDKSTIVRPIKNSIVLLNISSKSVNAIVKSVSKSEYTFELKYPCCMSVGEKFSISSKIGNSWRLIGMGTISDKKN